MKINLYEAFSDNTSNYREVYQKIEKETNNFSRLSGILEFNSKGDSEIAKSILDDFYPNAKIRDIDKNTEEELTYYIMYSTDIDEDLDKFKPNLNPVGTPLGKWGGIVEDNGELLNYTSGLKHIEFYNLDGDNPVLDFLLSIEDKKLQAKIMRDMKKLDDLGNNARPPLSSFVADGIFELRTKQSSNIAIVFYFFIYDNKIIMTNGYVKKEQKINKQEFKLAKQRMVKYMKENNL